MYEYDYDRGGRVGAGVCVGGAGVLVGGIGVLVGGINVLVGGTDVLVGGIGVLAGGIGVLVGGTAVLVGGIAVLVGGNDVLVGGIGVLVVGIGVLVGETAVLVGGIGVLVGGIRVLVGAGVSVSGFGRFSGSIVLVENGRWDGVPVGVASTMVAATVALPLAERVSVGVASGEALLAGSFVLARVVTACMSIVEETGVVGVCVTMLVGVKDCVAVLVKAKVKSGELVAVGAKRPSVGDACALNVGTEQRQTPSAVPP
jgi:hypothetical protein